MSKPINIEAQRIYKILTETAGTFLHSSTFLEKLRVLSLLNNEFFDEVYNRDLEELSKPTHFNLPYR